MYDEYSRLDRMDGLAQPPLYPSPMRPAARMNKPQGIRKSVKVALILVLVAGAAFVGAYFAGKANAEPFDPVTDPDIAANTYGNAICARFQVDGGVTKENLLHIADVFLESTALGPENAGVAVANAVALYCPQYSADLYNVADTALAENDVARHKRLA